MDVKHEVSKAEYDITMLTALLHYHERISMPIGQGICKQLNEEICPGKLAIDQYSEALREAIRCIRIVHKL